MALALVAGPLLADAGGWKPPGCRRRGVHHRPAACARCERRSDRRGGSSKTARCKTATSARRHAPGLRHGARARRLGRRDRRRGPFGAAGRVALRLGAGEALVLDRWCSLTCAPALPRAEGGRVPRSSCWRCVGARRRRLLSSLLIGPLVVGVVVHQGGDTALGVERWLGVAVRRVGLPCSRTGRAAYRSARARLRRARGGPGPARRGDRGQGRRRVRGGAARGLRSADARAIAALMQCGGVMTIAISLAVLERASSPVGCTRPSTWSALSRRSPPDPSYRGRGRSARSLRARGTGRRAMTGS